MKLAVLADIHGNLPALQQVAERIDRWQPDLVVVGGDIVNRGPCSAACLDLIAERPGWHMVRGNHEDYVLDHELPNADPARNPVTPQINYSSFWTYQQLDGRTASLAQLPYQLALSAPDGSEVRVCHASMRGTRDTIWPTTPDAQVAQQIAPAPGLFVNAHVHVPFIRRLGGTLMVNCGSAGSPCDGDARASYAQLVWQDGGWQATIVRLAYDRAQTERDFVLSGFFDNCGPVGRLIYHEWRSACSIVLPWIRDHQARVLAGEVDLESSVARYLDQLDLYR